MNTAKVYYDAEGDPQNIHHMVKHEPMWAANRIQEGEMWHELVKECERIIGTPDTAEAPHLSNLPNLVRDLITSKTTRESLCEGCDIEAPWCPMAENREVDTLDGIITKCYQRKNSGTKPVS